MEIGLLITLLGLGASATDQEITGRAQALTGLENKLRDTTGGKDGAAAFAVIEGWREGAAKLSEAQGELAKVQAREEQSAYQALVKTGEDNAQITPGNKAGVLAKFTTSEALGAYLSVAPRALPGQATASDRPANKPAEKTESAGSTWNGKAWADLKPAERAALFQADESLYHSMRDAALAAKKGGS